MTSLVTADNSKAFDSVEHGRLLGKLGWYRVDQCRFRAWLSGQTQSVRGSSSELPLTHGFVQGPALGPILYLGHTNDLPQRVPPGKTVMYADDSQFLDSEAQQNLLDLKNA